MRVSIGPYQNDGTPREVDVQIDDYDVWNMDHTLSLIIYPMLLKLKETKQGAPHVEDDDVPEDLRSTVEPIVNSDTGDTDNNYFRRWDYVLDEMIFAFECIHDGKWEEQFHVDEKFDKVGYNAFNDRIENGLELFGKYFRALWD